MKSILSIVILVIGYIANAQDPQLFEVNWNLQEINFSDNVITPPNSSFKAQLLLSETLLEVVHELCQDAYSSEITYTNANIFEIIPETITGLVGSCGDPTIVEFMSFHYNFYGLDTGVPNNTFTYEISEEGEVITLIITNNENNTAVYNNQTLGLANDAFLDVSILYDPQTENVSLIGVDTTTRITIYSITGQKQLETSFATGESINLYSLSKGVYFVTINAIENTKIHTFKFVKS